MNRVVSVTRVLGRRSLRLVILIGLGAGSVVSAVLVWNDSIGRPWLTALAILWAACVGLVALKSAAETTSSIERLVRESDADRCRVRDLQLRLADADARWSEFHNQHGATRDDVERLIERVDRLVDEVEAVRAFGDLAAREAAERLTAVRSEVARFRDEQSGSGTKLRAEVAALREETEAAGQLRAQQLSDVRPKVVWLAQRLDTAGLTPTSVDQAPDKPTSGGPQTRALLVNTIPKSGTYLVGSLLGELGLVDSGLHFRDELYWDFWAQPRSSVIGDPNQFRRDEPFERSIHLLGDRQFGVAHLEQPDEAMSVLERARVRTVFLVRELTECMVSMMRFTDDPRRWDGAASTDGGEPGERFAQFLRERGAFYLSGVQRQLRWLDTGVELFRFEDLCGDRGDAAQRASVARLVEAADITTIDADTATAVLRERVLGQPNRTFSGGRSAVDEYRTAEVDDLLRELDVESLNARLGYA